MSSIEIVSLIVTIVCLVSFCCAFTFLFLHYYKTEGEKVRSGRDDPALLEDICLDAEKKSDKKRKILTIVGKVLGDVVLVGVAAFFVFTLFSRFTSGAIFIGDQASLVIATGSMSERNQSNGYLFDNDLTDQFDAYDIIQIKKYDSPDQVKLYDVVAYKGLDGDIVVHRIIQMEDGGYITRGDANAASDTGISYKGVLSYDDILGYYTGSRIKGLGAIVIFIQSNAGIITIVSILYCFGMFTYLSSKYDRALEDRKEYLLSKIPIDQIDMESVMKAQSSFTEKLVYQGREYLLEPTADKKKEADDTTKEGLKK